MNIHFFSNKSIFIILALFVASTSGICNPLTVSVVKSRSVHVQVKAIELIAHMKLDYNAMSYFSLLLDPPLALDEDYEIDYLKPENSLPIQYRHNKIENSTVFALTLKPGKAWLKGAEHNSSNSSNSDTTFSSSKTLQIIGASWCSTHTESIANVPVAIGSNLRIASFFGSKQHHCPVLPSLPGATSELNAYLKDVLHTCANLRIFKSRKLNGHHINSFSLLLPNVAMILVDASDQNSLIDAAKIVDTFLASHSVLDLVWEPYSDDEPKWFVLIPRPRGMPGHLFAMMDTVQWHHPSVTTRKGKLDPQCSITDRNESCVMGCPDTFLSRMTGSGWGADSWHTMIDARRAMMYEIPVQAAPLTFDGAKLGGPVWKGKFGWTYTYGGCSTNMLDCYFLEHSPCPIVTVDPYAVLPSNNRSRVKAWNTPGIRKIDEVSSTSMDLWWNNVFLPYQPQHMLESSDQYIPSFTVAHKWAMPAEQVFGSLFWRPKYELRKETQKRVNNFNLQEACATMHVRRSDVIQHRGQSRSYIRVESYVRGARPVMDALGIKTIVLFTDSMSAIEEAMNCTKEYPDVCEGIKFRYVEKKRWYGAEGGWENHLPSGDPQLELYHIQAEFVLATKCSMIITGSSSYGEKLRHQMCCGFPLHERGHLPKRCVCPPHIQAEPRGFGSCEEGNLLLCKNMTIDAKTFTQENIAQPANKIHMHDNVGHTLRYNLGRTENIETKIAENIKIRNDLTAEYIERMIKQLCRKYDHGPRIESYCAKYSNVTMI